MNGVRTYRFECCWLALLIVLFLLAPTRAAVADMGFDFEDIAFDCDGWVGWCVPFEMF